MNRPGVVWIAAVIGCVAPVIGCGFLLPDRIHAVVEPGSSLSCAANARHEPQTEIFGVALSGGGSRAAVFGAAGLEAMWEHGVLDRISHLSSVSGGSIAASYLVTNWPDCDSGVDPGSVESCWRRFFAEFKQTMRYDFAWATELRQVPFPNRWMSPTRRVTSFQEVLDREFLAGVSFGQLSSPRAGDLPMLLVNAASYDEARRFIFSNVCIGSPRGDLRSASFSRPGCDVAVPRDFPVSLAVTASAAFPGLFGPVGFEVPASCDAGQDEWWHLGDGGMIDNTGLDTLEELVLATAESGNADLSTAVLIGFDSSRILRKAHQKRLSNYALLARDPSRIVTVTKARGVAFHGYAWAEMKRGLAARGVRAEEMLLRYMAAELEQWPESCGSDASAAEHATSQVEPIRDRLEEIPTALSIDDCGADLLERAAHQIVHAQLNGDQGETLRELGIPVRAYRH